MYSLSVDVREQSGGAQKNKAFLVNSSSSFEARGVSVYQW